MNADLTTLTATNAMQAGRNPNLRSSGDSSSLNKTAQEFEGVFLSEMLRPMFEGLDSDGYFEGGVGESMFRSLLVDAFGKEMSAQGGIGLGDSVMKELLKSQEMAQ